MTKYNKKALGAAEDSVALSHDLTNRAIATAVFDTLTRAPWWEEVEVGYEFQPGEPGRHESDRRVSERATTGLHLSIIAAERGTFFRDTRWQPPAPLAVGDLIETEEQAASLPVGTIAVTKSNAVFRKAGMNEWRRGPDERGLRLADFEMAFADDRIIYLPSGVSE